MLIDYHLHNHFSPDSEADTKALIEAELKRGVQEICFTNHAEWFDVKTRSGIGVFDDEEAIRRFEAHKWEVETFNEKYPKLPIKFGVEVTFNNQILADLESFINQMDFDFVLGSIHNMEGHVINSSKYAEEFFPGREEEETYKAYFKELDEMVDWGHFDVVAHFDVIKKCGTQYFGKFEPEKYEAQIRPILKKIASKKLGIELNTQAIEKACKEVFPHPRILKWALEEGVEIFTFSSDAHKPEYAAKNLQVALDTAKKVGIKNVATFAKRKPTLHKI